MADHNEVLTFISKQSKDNCLDLLDAHKAADTFGCSLSQIEKIALTHSILPTRFQRNGLSCSDQLRLLQSTIAVIGCGGLGGRTAELLARIGIGRLILTDPDIFSESNLNRQIFCNIKSLGSNKVDVVGRELQAVNPALKTTRQCMEFNTESIVSADIVMDCLDSAGARIELSEICRKQDIPMVHGAVSQWYGQAGVDLAPNTLISTLYPQKTIPLETPTVMPMSVALIASIQVAEAIKLILGQDSPLLSGWMQTDLLRCDYDTILIPSGS